MDDPSYPPSRIEETMLKRVERIIFSAARKFNVVSGVALTAMMVLVFSNVVLRAVWRPVLGTYEFTAFLASVTISFALANCAVEKGHVAITLFTDRLSSRSQAVCGIVVGLISTALFTVLSWQSALYAMVIRRSGEVAPTTETPFFPFIFGIAFGFALLAAVHLIDLLKSLKKVVKR
jgi:TRAP-type C4-dicarboxylate transport system permease small subunit